MPLDFKICPVIIVSRVREIRIRCAIEFEWVITTADGQTITAISGVASKKLESKI